MKMKKKFFFIYKLLFLSFLYSFIDYKKSFDIKVRDKNNRTNLGKIYFDKIYTEITIILKVKTISFKK